MGPAECHVTWLPHHGVTTTKARVRRDQNQGSRRSDPDLTGRPSLVDAIDGSRSAFNSQGDIGSVSG